LRPHLTVLVTGHPRSRARVELRSLGATVVFEPMETIIGTLRRGTTSRLTADAIVIDCSFRALGGAGEILSGINLARALVALSDMYVMRNGVRWNAIPIVLVAFDDVIGSLLRNDPDLWKIETVSLLSGVPVGPMTRGWECVYDALVRTHRPFVATLRDAMEWAGLMLRYESGRLVRRGLRPPMRRASRFNKFESALYDPNSDYWLKAQGALERRARETVAVDESGVAGALRDLEALVRDPKEREQLAQLLIERNPYLFDIAPFEMVAQPVFTRDDGSEIRPDIIRHAFQPGRSRPDNRIFELKKAGVPQMYPPGPRSHFRPGVHATAAQLLDYSRHIRSHPEQCHAIFGETLSAPGMTAIVGRVGNADRGRLAEERSRYGDMEIRGYDEIAHENRVRYDVPDGWEPDQA